MSSSAATKTAIMTTFPMFTQLPPEIRSHIWTSVLPVSLPPALFISKAGCWEVTKPERNDRTLHYRHDRLAKVVLRFPLFHACREARKAVILWARKQHGALTVGTHPDFKSITIGSVFDPFKDILYFPGGRRNGLDDFYENPYHSWVRPEDGERIPTYVNAVRTIAIHAGSFDQMGRMYNLDDILMRYLGSVDRIVLIFNGNWGQVQFQDPECTLQDRWEIEEAPALDELGRMSSPWHISADVKESLCEWLPELERIKVEPWRLKRTRWSF